MKGKFSSLLWVLVTLFASFQASAQDDLYYNPSTDAAAKKHSDNYSDDYSDNRRYEDDEDYYYDEEDDYAYEYSSRIRRFHRPSYGIDYFDPFYVDLYHYDPFFSPGASIYVYNYNDYWTWRRWRRWNSWNTWNTYNTWGWGWGFNSWGWTSCSSGYNPWYNPWAMNNYYYDPYWTWNGYNPYFSNNVIWVNNNYYNNNNFNNGGGGGNNGGYVPQTYTGVRRHGSSVNPGYARIPDGSGRLNTGQKDVPIVEKPALRGRTAGDIAPANNNAAAERAQGPSTPSGRRPAGMDDRNMEKGARTSPPTPADRKPSGEATRRTQEPATRQTEPSRRNDDARTPARPREDVRPSTPRPSTPRTETPSPARRENGGYNTQERSEPKEEARPVRRAEERPAYTPPSRSSESYNTPSRSSESRPATSTPRSYDSGSSGRSSTPAPSGGGGSTRSSSGGGATRNSGGRN